MIGYLSSAIKIAFERCSGIIPPSLPAKAYDSPFRNTSSSIRQKDL